MPYPPYDTNGVILSGNSAVTVRVGPCDNSSSTAARSPYPLVERRSKRSAGVYNGYPSLTHFSMPTAYSRIQGVLQYPTGYVKASTVGYTQACAATGFVAKPATQIATQFAGFIRKPFAASISYDTGVLNRCTTQLLLSLKNEGEASLGLALLERKETEDLFISALKKISYSVSAYRKASPKGWAKTMRAFSFRDKLASQGRLQYRRFGTPSPALLKRPLSKREKSLMKVPNQFLEIQYGWKPLIQDVHEALKAVDFAQTNNLYRFYHTAKARKNVDFTSVFQEYFVSTFKYNITGRRTFRCLMRVDYNIDTSGLATASAAGLTNPADLIWERVPFSFVLDWALPVGDYLNQFDATLGKTFIAGSTSQSIRDDQFVGSWDIPGTLIPPGTFYSLLPLDGVRNNYFQFDRTVMSSFPSPAPPTFKNPCSPVHVANAIALLTSAMFGGVPRGLSR